MNRRIGDGLCNREVSPFIPTDGPSIGSSFVVRRHCRLNGGIGINIPEYPVHQAGAWPTRIVQNIYICDKHANMLR